MNAASQSLDLRALRTQALTRWQALAPRERVMVGAAAIALGVLLVWMVALQPALRTLKTVPPEIADADAKLQRMHALSAEVRDLRSTPPVSSDQALAALRAASERLGQSARLTITGDRATLSVNGMEGTAILTWLSEVRSGARGRVVEAKLTRGQNGYTGSIVVALGRSS